MSKQALLRRLRRFNRAFDTNGDSRARCACYSALEGTDYVAKLWQSCMIAENGPDFYR
jgi:hypothetical protein